MISMRIAAQGYKIAYTPDAFALETASANVKEELKRKVRIAAGGIQSIVRLSSLLNVFRYKWLSFQYVSHRVLRWTLAPLALIVVLLGNVALWNTSIYYNVLLILQIMFYLAVLTGHWLENRKLRIKILFVPYYFFIMNYAVFQGFARYLNGKQKVTWEKAKRAN